MFDKLVQRCLQLSLTDKTGSEYLYAYLFFLIVPFLLGFVDEFVERTIARATASLVLTLGARTITT